MNVAATDEAYKGKDNQIEWWFTERKFNYDQKSWEEQPIDFITKIQVTKMVLHIAGNSIESGDGKLTYFDSGRVVLILGHVAELTANTDELVTLDVYSEAKPNGVTMVHPGNAKSSAMIKIRNPAT
jgi:hypothetical protein